MIKTITPVSITTAAGATVIALPDNFIPAAGQVLNIPLTATIPDGTNGTVITITSGGAAGNLLNTVGNNVRMGTLNAQWVLRVKFFNDPAHYNLLNRLWRPLV